MGSVTKLQPGQPPNVAFHKSEMSRILDVYGRMVMAGQAKDYAIGMYRDHAVFAIFRRHAEAPTWRIEKVPALRNQQGAYAVYGSQNQILKRGHDLAQVLRVFDRRRFEIIK
ncbi:DUF2794 domain-containing protein [Henriciella aquimarina]|uniref:DUF2794 domain-containing protein n=1 Tax=Henriciella aquimarina TaxID=545261 RepID=UPI0009FD25CB|nr:DUF2794 domain-containing protein [Henriciella aquimarina]